MSTLLGVAAGAAFVTGLAGGVHCAGMCGGIVHAFTAARGAAGRARPRYLIAYNAGRVVSYACAGALAGALGQAGLLTRAAPLLQPVFTVAASVSLILLGGWLTGLLPGVARIEALGAHVWRRLQPLTRHLVPVTSLPRALALGALWGWLPCGMVYLVLLTALALGTAREGALVMLAFGLGTLPNLLGLGLVWQRVLLRRRAALPRLLAGTLIAGFGFYGLVWSVQPPDIGTDGLICRPAPRQAAMLR